MSEISMSAAPKPRRDIGLKKRYRAERRFKAYGISAIAIGIIFLVVLITSILTNGYTVFGQTTMSLSVKLDKAIIDPKDQRSTNPNVLMTANYPLLIRNALAQRFGVSLDDRAKLRQINAMFSDGVRGQLREMVIKDPSIIGSTQTINILASSDIDQAYKGHIDLSAPETNRKVSNQQVEWMGELAKDGALYKAFNTGFFVNTPSARPEMAGLGVALLGTLYMMIIVVGLSVPIGVAAAIYLEEYAKKNKFTDLIEVNINNLAAVPSIVFGLLGLAIFINFFGIPRSTSLVGGLVLTLMTLPTIIIATRSALRAVPPSIRTAALGVGASKTQMVFQHVLPLAVPGVLTGTIIGMARALGETAPLLLIGMKAFVGNYPTTPLDPATALPMQIYMWVDGAERGLQERAWGGIIVLLVFMIIMNITAVILRRKYERRW
ncbi:phosphate ABC transporter permease PstA [Bartonella sp. HY329]|uniref:phosphate ABC transporter permease PstA n=1 Tax=unclassified Bartonella TaxID=2645622 RepID=UPI0021C958EA|nr:MULTISPECIES: phosphate ABC transporter permease PstA [unclassified Bartonella]UXM95516.1 phosphate ABC transporter permease PstA [Bartonella sp. HY329]UXN09841.1 phosphate ABC transporter permease PstA [Bartonella sp. HY328]